MKKILLVLLAICTVSCSKDDEHEKNVAEQRRLVNEITNSFAGTYDVEVTSYPDEVSEFTTIIVEDKDKEDWGYRLTYTLKWKDIEFNLGGHIQFVSMTVIRYLFLMDDQVVEEDGKEIRYSAAAYVNKDRFHIEIKEYWDKEKVATHHMYYGYN